MRTDTQNITDIAGEIKHAMVEINDLKISFSGFKKTVERSIESMRETIDNKGQDFITTTQIIKREIDKIKNSIQSNDALERCVWRLPMATKFTNIVSGSAMVFLEHQYDTQLEQLQNRVTEIEQTNKHTEEMVNDLVTSIATFMKHDRPVNEPLQHDRLDDKIGDMENSIECMQHEINRIKTSSHIDEEKTIKMNKQLHILSSKYVDFNTKICRFISDFNRINVNKIHPDKIIDADAKPFMATECTKYDENNRKSKNNVHLASNRFVKPYDKNEYTRMMRVEIRSFNNDNLDRMKRKFVNLFEASIGNNMVKNATVTRYRLHNNEITSISFAVEFQIPLNYEYIDNIKFPNEWFFFPINKQQHNAARFIRSTKGNN